MRRPAYVDGLRAALQGIALPYGYTVTVWSSGQELIHLQGLPPAWVVFLFAAGAAAGFGVLRTITPRVESGPQLQLGAGTNALRAGMIHVTAIGAAIGAVTLIGLIHSTIAWPLGGFAATSIYIVAVSVELGLRVADAA